MPCPLIYNGANDGMVEKNEQWHCHGTEEDGEWEK